MKNKLVKSILSFCLAGAMALTAGAAWAVPAAAAGTEAAEKLILRESEISQLLTEDLILPDRIDGYQDAEITYSVAEKDADYAAVEGNILKITRPYAGKGHYSFNLKAEIKAAGETIQKEFPLTIAEGTGEDSYAGYVYACFGNVNGEDVQQLHLFLSEDGLNWTALNGFRPVFEVGSDHAGLIEQAGTHNYRVKAGADIGATVSGDASVLFPFEGRDQGIRDPYIIRGARAEDADKVWILATDLNTMAAHYDGNLDAPKVGNWGKMSQQGSTNLFIYETEDWVNWTRRYVDVGSVIDAGAAWAPEAIYNPEKDNYLIYWSCRVGTDGYARNRLYCNETKDFKTFGPTKLYEAEAFYEKWGALVGGNDGYGNIDTSQLWVADGNENPYGTLFRLVKDETDNHIELMSAGSVLDPAVAYEQTDPTRISPFTKDNKTYRTAGDLQGLNDFQKAEVVYKWFEQESTGNHFSYIAQGDMERLAGHYEGATMFKFFDRDEWCIMIDNYGSSAIRYEPYLTTDLAQPNSIAKVADGYGRTGGDVGCHGGMIPVTAKEYNRLIETYNSDPTVPNYHQIDFIQLDSREITAEVEKFSEMLRNKEGLTAAEKAELEKLLKLVEQLKDSPLADRTQIDLLFEHLETRLNPREIKVAKEQIQVKAGQTAAIEVLAAPAGVPLTYSSGDQQVAEVKDGKIRGVAQGTTFIFVKAGKQAIAVIQVTVN